ncbi:MAG: glutamine-hydrolyzing GMP synthase [Clostridiales bacterium]|jgi:GMP synthase (glutamine-hydrolysing)|nr:glutamine-hydrolyzing GMP synthase [Clostridiales bacterium]
MPDHELLIVLDFGGQYNQLIARRVRDEGVYCEVLPYTTPLEKLMERSPKGFILTGGPNSVNAPTAPRCPAELFSLGVPVLGICYGAQLIAATLGGRVLSDEKSEYGAVEMTLIEPGARDGRLFTGVDAVSTCWMSHNDRVAELPEGFCATARTARCANAAFEDRARGLYAVQFHPEVLHTVFGRQILKNFVYAVCGFSGDWRMSGFVRDSIARLREKIGDKKALCALSGGVDSTVAAVLLHRAIGKRLTCIFVDNGLLRKGEADSVEAMCKGQFEMNFVRVDAADRFLSRLAGVTEPERKRKIIGEEFIRVVEEAAKRIGQVDFLVQGTIYPDVIESGLGDSAVIKSHHNVGGLPKDVGFSEIIEPLRLLFKDEVRRAGLELGIPEEIVWRQPFPGPGLSVRVLGDVTEEKLATLREADAIFREEIANAGIARDISQYFAVLTNLKTVGVKGDERSYESVVALRAVKTDDFMTADFSRVPYEVLAKASSRIVNEVPRVNRVVYDITAKPPATIEWE